LEVELRSGPQSKFHPYTVTAARDRLTAPIMTAAADVHAMPAELRGERVIVEMTLLPNYLASTWQPLGLLQAIDAVPVGARWGTAEYLTKSGLQSEEEPTKALQVAVAEDSLDRLGTILADEHPHRVTEGLQDQVRRFADVSLPGPATVLPHVAVGHDVEIWEAVLHPAVDRFGGRSAGAARSQLKALQDWVQALHGEMDPDLRRTVGGLTYVPVRLPAGERMRLAQFNGLKHLTPEPRMVAVPLSVEPSGLAGAAGGAPVSPHPIALFDVGVDVASPGLNGLVTEIDLTGGTVPTADDVAHGTLAASAAMYGPWQAGPPVVVPAAPVHLFRVGPVPDGVVSQVAWVMDQIESTLQAHDYRIAVVTYVPEMAVGAYGPTVHSWTARLDQLARERDVLIVSPAGNDGTPDPRPGDGSDRIRIGADAVNGISVGAADAPAGDWDRAEYSCRGPGRSGAAVQPTVMAFGGIDALPFLGAAPGTEAQQNLGTSFAAPTAAGQLARLDAVLDNRSAPETLRAFAVHLSDVHPSHDPDDHGHGRLPEDLLDAADCGPDSVTMLIQDQLSRNQPIAYPLPVPTGLTGNLRIHWTVSYLSPVDPTSDVEYCSAGLEVQWRPHDGKFTMNPPKGVKAKAMPINLDKPADATRYGQLLAAGWSRSNPVTAGSTRVKTEQLLRDEGKWQTTINASDGKRATSLRNPHLWVNYLYRQDGVLQPDGIAPTQPVTILITVTAAAGSNIYDTVRAAAPFNVLTPLTVPATVRVRAGS
jgi:hypothetical protein